MNSPLVLSLFPGIGLLDRAFEEEGYCVVRGPDVLWGGDVRRFHPSPGRFDGILGGPPCQCFSPLAHLVRAHGYEPKFGNLIPEYERCVSEAQPLWFLMEQVPQAPEPVVPGYGVRSFLLDNSALSDGTGFGLEQRRIRRFSFGLRGVSEPPCLLRWIDLAVFLLPDADGTLTQWTPDNSAEAKGRTPRPALLSDPSEVPVKIGGSGKVKRTCKAVVSRPGLEVVGKHGKAKRQEIAAEKQRTRQSRVTAGYEQPDGLTARKKAVPAGPLPGAHGGASVRMGRYRLADACRLQGLPEDFLADAPFTAQGKLKAIANGVPLPMGRAIAKALKEAIGDRP